MKPNEEQYIKGFNSGYLLAKHEPELAQQLVIQKNDESDYFRGLVSGKKEYDREAELELWLNNFSKGKPAKGEKEQGKER